MDRKNSEAKIKANNKYTNENYDRFNLRVRKDSGLMQQIKAKAKENNQSINDFIVTAIKNSL